MNKNLPAPISVANSTHQTPTSQLNPQKQRNPLKQLVNKNVFLDLNGSQKIASKLKECLQLIDAVNIFESKAINSVKICFICY